MGFLGMGAMGTEMTLNLLKANFNVYVWNRTITKVHLIYMSISNIHIVCS